jgi:DNA-binding transcriptional ArsR family regulator
MRIDRYKGYDAGVDGAPDGDQVTSPPHPDSLSDEQVNAAVVALSLLAEPTRIRMLWALRQPGLDVATLASVAGCTPAVASQHLSRLRLAGLVEATREGRRMLYRIRDGHVRTMLAEALFHADHEVTGQPSHQ